MTLTRINTRYKHIIGRFRSLWSIILLSTFALAIHPYVTLAGRESEYSDKYPKLTFIESLNSALYFAGTWYGQLIVVELDSSGRWQTFSKPAPWTADQYHCSILIQSGLLLFSADAHTVPFNPATRQWLRDTSMVLAQRSSPSQFSISGPTLVIQDDTGAARYEFPQPSFNAFRRWRGNLGTYYFIDAAIGEHILLENEIWFLIDFYDGEGFTGVGGLGIFDFKTRKFGVFRDNLLSNCSSGYLGQKGDTLIVATNHSGEYGTFGCNGLVLINLKSGVLCHIPRDSLPVDGSYFLGMKLVSETLWMLTDRAIVGWNMTTNEWTSTRLETVVARDSSQLFVHVNDVATPIRQVPRGSELRYYWPSWRRMTAGADFTMMAEVAGTTSLPGWVSKEQFDERKGKTQEMVTYGPDILVFKDSSLTSPLHSFRFAELNEVGRSRRAVEVKVPALVLFDKIAPRFSEQHRLSYIPGWVANHDLHSVKERALDELEREQSEIHNEVPIYDTLLTIHRGMDLYDHVLDAMWLPDRSFESLSPTGIWVTFHFHFEGGEEFALIAKKGKLFKDSGAVKRNDSWNILGPNVRASFKLIDFKLSNNGMQLEEIKLQYTLRLFPLPRYDE